MTREETREAVKVMVAYANGKEIQYLDDNNKWIDTPNPVFDWSRWAYRVKSKPEYRPFKTQEECWNEMHKHPDFGWVKVNVTGEYEQIVRIFDYCKTELCFKIANSDDDYTSEMMLNSYTFTDGTPFGIKE